METDKQVYYSNNEIMTVNHELDRLISSHALSPDLLENILENFPILKAAEQPLSSRSISPQEAQTPREAPKETPKEAPREEPASSSKVEAPTPSARNLAVFQLNQNGGNRPIFFSVPNSNFQRDTTHLLATSQTASKPSIPNLTPSNQPLLRSNPSATTALPLQTVQEARKSPFEPSVRTTSIPIPQETAQRSNISSNDSETPSFAQKEAVEEASILNSDFSESQMGDSIEFPATEIAMEAFAEVSSDSDSSYPNPSQPETHAAEQEAEIARPMPPSIPTPSSVKSQSSTPVPPNTPNTPVDPPTTTPQTRKSVV